MKKALVAVLTSAMFAGMAMSAGMEIDLDGTQGNGPDVVQAAVSDYIAADVWITGQAALPIIVVGYTLCNLDGSLEFQGFADATGWGTVTPPADLGGGCWQFSSSDFTGALGMLPPFLAGTVTYHAAVDGTCDDITLDALGSSYLTLGFGQFPFDNFVGATVCIGDTGTEEASWGAVKGLFR